MFLTNAFSINMFPTQSKRIVKFIPLTPEQARGVAAEFANELIPAIGHAPTAAIVNAMFGVELAHRRDTVVFSPEDQMIVTQYTGPRLPEGAVVLPDGAVINYWLVEEA